MISTRAPASTPWVGSSTRTTWGLPIRARASSTFCWLPPESEETDVSRVGVFTARPEIASRVKRYSRERWTNLVGMTTSSEGATTFSRTDILPNIASPRRSRAGTRCPIFARLAWTAR
ncbi:MAG: hypothetical protein R2740_02900 [Nocardioides sp.]